MTSNVNLWGRHLGRLLVAGAVVPLIVAGCNSSSSSSSGNGGDTDRDVQQVQLTQEEADTAAAAGSIDAVDEVDVLIEAAMEQAEPQDGFDLAGGAVASGASEIEEKLTRESGGAIAAGSNGWGSHQCGEGGTINVDRDVDFLDVQADQCRDIEEQDEVIRFRLETLVDGQLTVDESWASESPDYANVTSFDANDWLTEIAMESGDAEPLTSVMRMNGGITHEYNENNDVEDDFLTQMTQDFSQDITMECGSTYFDMEYAVAGGNGLTVEATPVSGADKFDLSINGGLVMSFASNASGSGQGFQQELTWETKEDLRYSTDAYEDGGFPETGTLAVSGEVGGQAVDLTLTYSNGQVCVEGATGPLAAGDGCFTQAELDDMDEDDDAEELIDLDQSAFDECMPTL